MHRSNFFGARIENPKIKKRGVGGGRGWEVLITAGWIRFLFSNKLSGREGGRGRGAFIRDLRALHLI